MANIRRRAGKFQVQIRKKGYPPAVKTFTKFLDAKQWLTETEHRIASGRRPEQLCADIQFEQLLDRYIRTHIPKLKAPKQELSLTRRVSGRLGSYPCSALTNATLATYRDQRSSEVAPQTVKHEINLVRRVIKLAIAEWGLGVAEVPYVRLPRLPSGRERRLEPEEINALLLCLGDQMKEIVSFALETAMRRSEILGLARGDFDAQNKTVTLKDTKNGRSRTIPLSCTALEILNRRTQDGTMFTMQPDSVSQALRRACHKLELKDYRFHDLRHEAISRLFERGLSVPQVAMISGHQDYRMLARYVHLHRFEL